MKEEKVQRWVLAGTDYVYPRTTNKILEAYLKSKGVEAGRHHDQLHAVRPFRLADRSSPTSRSSARPARRPRSSRPSTATPTCRSTRSSATRASRPTDIPVVAFSVGEEELAGIDTKPLVGHLAAWNYFESIETPANKAFIDEVAGLHQERRSASPTTRWKRTYIGFNMWVKAVEKAEHDRSGQGDRRAARHRGAEPDRRHLEDAAEPPHHQAGVHRRDRGRRPVRRGVEDAGPRRRATPGRTSSTAPRTWSPTGSTHEVRQLQHQDQQVRRS